MPLRPLHDRLVVRKKPALEVSRGGIVLLPGSNEHDSALEGTVLAVGPGMLRPNGERRAMTVKVGEDVFFNKFAGYTVKVDNQEIVVLQEIDILAHGDPSADALQPDATATA